MTYLLGSDDEPTVRVPRLTMAQMVSGDPDGRGDDEEGGWRVCATGQLSW
ncbi:MAG TPA: hypothetical protein VFV05_00985 [Methylomirabilota bacterium]|nr:hypothetical protein [Methylomirabilota bacterium]